MSSKPDTRSNKKPNNDEILLTLERMEKTLKDVATGQSSLEAKLDTLVQRIDKQQTEIVELKDSANYCCNEIDEMKLATATASDTLKNQEAVINEFSARITTLENQLDDSLRYSRGFNLRFLDIAEENQPRNEDCIAKIQQLIHDAMGIKVEVENAHRTGSLIPGKPRHIIAKFLKRPHRFEVLRQRSLLKKSGVRVFEDVIHKDLEARRRLKHVVDEARANGKKTRFLKGTLIIDGKEYVPPCQS